MDEVESVRFLPVVIVRPFFPAVLTGKLRYRVLNTWQRMQDAGIGGRGDARKMSGSGAIGALGALGAACAKSPPRHQITTVCTPPDARD